MFDREADLAKAAAGSSRFAPITTIGFDADDTLWRNEDGFHRMQERFRAIVGRYVVEAGVDETLLAVERRNLEVFGYGAKGFVLSLIETALELTGRRITGQDIGEIVDMLHSFLSDPREAMDGAEAVLKTLSSAYRLLLITKGDVVEQDAKIARSGLAPYFDGIHILAEKDGTAYRKVLRDAGVEPNAFVMVGNSVRSDIEPVLAIGGRAIHIPYHLTWSHERVEIDVESEFEVLTTMAELPACLDRLAAQVTREGPRS